MQAKEQHTTAERDIFIVDDEPAILDLLSEIFSLNGFRVSGFGDGDAFLAAVRERAPACIIMDVYMPGRSGLEILKDLQTQQCQAPVFIISGQGDIPTAVEAIKRGALDFIEKPFDTEAVVQRVRDALEAQSRRDNGDGADRPMAHFPGRELLTPRESDVLKQIAGGASNKEAGRYLGISPRTIEVHRARIMEKLGAKNAADLVRIVLSEGR